MSEQNSYGLEEVHKQLLKTLNAFDKICRKYGIHYSLHGGTLLGAERNHKLIPWDDDIDVSMTRAEYEKFRKVMRGAKGRFYLDQYTMWFPRFVMKLEQPVYIDILIWDYISENKIAQFFKINLLRAVQGMMKTDIDYSRFGIGGKFLLFTTNSAGKLLSVRNKKKLYTYLETKCFLGTKKYIHRSNDAFKSVAYIMDKDYMKDYTDIMLEGRAYMVTTRYIEFLKMSYGDDYMTPPPENERKPMHTRFRNALS